MKLNHKRDSYYQRTENTQICACMYKSDCDHLQWREEEETPQISSSHHRCLLPVVCLRGKGN